jgi:hypothetical protein
VALKNTVNYTGKQPLIYNWTADATLDNPNIANPEASPVGQRNYSVRVTDGVCVANASATVFVSPLTVYAGSDRAAYCGNAVIISKPSSNYTGTKPLIYRWSPAKGLNDTTAEQPLASLRQTQTYKVLVKTHNGCMASDEVTLVLQAQPAPNICFVTTDNQNRNMVLWDTTSVASADSFFIYRDASGGSFEKVGIVSGHSAGVFTDLASGAGSHSRRYRSSLVDECGLGSGQSAFHRTVHLGITPGVAGQWNLFWNNYEGENVNAIKVLRGKNLDSMAMIATISSFNNFFTDNTAPSGDVYYRLEFVLASDCNLPGTSNLPQSNMVYSRNASNSNAINRLILPLNVKPNPSTGIFTLEGLTKGVLGVYNTAGQLVANNNTIPGTNTIDLGALPTGVYRARFIDSTTGNFMTATLVKQ